MTYRKLTLRAAALGALTGLLAAAVAVAVSYLVAGFTGADSGSVVAVGQASIDLTPPPVKNFAVTEFGSHDKMALLIGIAVILAIFAVIIGIAALRRLWYGLAGLAVFTAIGLAAAASRPTAGAAYVLPTLAGAVAGIAAMVYLTRTAVPLVAPGAMTGAGPSAGRAAAGPPERRRFLSVTAVAAGTALVGYLAGRELAERKAVTAAQQALRLPPPMAPAPRLPAGAELNIPGLSPFITPNGSFYRVDTAIVLPEVPPSSWRLRIHGMVAREIQLTFDDLIRRPLTEDYITLTCVSNPVGGPLAGNARWLGASLRSLLREAGIRAGADQLLCTSADGFTSGSPVQTAMDGRDAMLAVAMNGSALPIAHGFPVRMVVPGLYGYVSACKWITDIEVTTYGSSVAYWSQRGWNQQAPIKTESRIDVPNGQSPVSPGRVTVAGVAWAQHKGIAAVEVRVDRGPWHRARLAAVPDIDCWRQWSFEWDATAGTHLIEARATDATGYTQTAAQAPPEPNGATGYPLVQVSVIG